MKHEPWSDEWIDAIFMGVWDTVPKFPALFNERELDRKFARAIAAAAMEEAATIAESCICEEGDLLHRKNCPTPFPSQAIRARAKEIARG